MFMKKIISIKDQQKAIRLIEKIKQQTIGFRKVFFNECLKEMDMNLIYESLKKKQIDAIIKLADSDRNKKRNISNVTKPNTIPIAKKQKTESVKKEIDLSSRRNITDKDLKQYADYTHINLSGCKNITDAGLAHLTSVTTINLHLCKKITDAGLAYLKHVTEIYLPGCNNITDVGLTHLPKNLIKINISRCNLITNNSIIKFKNLQEIDLRFCKNITTDILVNFPKLKKLKFKKRKKIIKANIHLSRHIEKIDNFYTNFGLSKLDKNLTIIDLSYNPYITDAGLADLIYITSISLPGQITDAGLANLPQSVTNINLSCCFKITDAGLAHLKHVTEINLAWCEQITDDGLINLFFEAVHRSHFL